MQSKKTLNQSIIDITNRIYLEFPELTKYIKEIPSISTESDDEKISNQNLLNYYNSLHDIITQYSKTHLEKAKKNKALLVEVIEYPYYGESEDIYIYILKAKKNKTLTQKIVLKTNLTTKVKIRN